MPKFTIDYTFNATATEIIEAATLEDAERIIDDKINDEDFIPDADSVDDIDFTVREMHPVTRDGREMWTTRVWATDVRGHASALKTAPLFAEAS